MISGREIVELEVEVRTHELEMMKFYPETFAAQIAAGQEYLALMADPAYFEARVLLEIAKTQAQERARAPRPALILKPEELIV